MLFDLRGSGRRRTVKIVYITLAFLMGGGLILFGIGGGGALPGGLVDAIQQGGSGDSGTDRFVQQEEQASAKARANPTAANWAAVARARFNVANTGDNVDPSTGNYTDAGAEQLRAAGRAWDESVKLAGKKAPDSRVASLMVQAYAGLGQLEQGDRRAGDRRARPQLRRRVRHAGDAGLPGEQPAPRRPGQGQGARPHRAGHARVAARPARIGPRAGGAGLRPGDADADADSGGEVAERLQSDAAPL